MAAWDGVGLPPVAAQRARRAAASGVWTSMLSAPAAAGLRMAGFQPVGEVMGSMVQQIAYGGYCGYSYGTGLGFTAPPTNGRGPGFEPLAQALTAGYHTALDRLVQEASAIGADGVVGVRITSLPIDGNVREFTALGTAVRAVRPTGPSRVFTTGLPGQDVAKLVASGWIPAGLVFGVAVGIRHDDYRTQQLASWMAGNVEVDTYTELVTRTRADARARFADHTRRAGAAGAIVSSMDLRVFSIEPGEGHRDHVAEALIFGTALNRTAVPPTAAGPSLTMMSLRDRTTRRVS